MKNFSLLLLHLGTIGIRSLAAGDNDLGVRLLQAEQRRESQIREIRCVRRYVLHNPRWDSDATMDVVMTWDGRSPKRFEVTAMDAGGFQKRVLMKLMEEEAEGSARRHADSAITGENYHMEPAGLHTVEGRSCQMVTLRPKKKNKLMIEGRACIDPRDEAVVMMEGRTAKRLSFWVGKADVSQQFKKIGDYWVLSHNQSTANVKLIGPTTLTIYFLEYRITPSKGPPLVTRIAATKL